jgi:ATP-dependent DNA ligase
MSKLPTLYHKAKKGDLREWTVWSVGDTIYTSYGQVGGQLQISTKKAEPKNVGRSNATSSEEQAKLEAKSLWTYKVERKYSETPEGAQEDLYLPMLAHTFKEGKVKFPCDLQPKIDGVRCLAAREGNNIILTSRQGKPWNIPIIGSLLNGWLPENTVLDGEIYIHGESCQKITSLAKSADPGGKSYKVESKILEYHIYDIPVSTGFDDLTWETRRELLRGYERAAGLGGQIKIVSTISVTSEKNMWDAHDSFVQDGYEGAVIRLPEGKYLWGYRSRELLKVKKFQDGEFLVTDARDGRGKMAGKVVWVCQNDVSEATFECSMKVSMEEREAMFKNRKDYIGRQLTVRYFGLTDDNIPRFPVGIVFRDEKDLPT